MRRPHRRVLILRGLGRGGAFAWSALLLAASAVAQPSEIRPDPVVVEVGAQSFRPTGEDRGAPRTLVLWRFAEGAFRRVATTQSDTNGRFDFGEQSWPIAPGSFHVAPANTAPDRARPIGVERPLPSPTIQSSGLDPNRITIGAALMDGAIEIRDLDTRRLLLRRAVTPESRGRLSIDFLAEGIIGGTRTVTLEQVLPDGRRSEPIGWSLASPD